MIEEEEALTEEEWALAQILTNPVMFREFINEGDPNWKPLEDHERAWTSCDAQYVCMCCGRGVRKTTSMIEMLYYWMVNEMFIPGDPGLLVYVPNKAQKDAIWPRIRSACESHWLISRLTNHNKINAQDGRIEFVNGFFFIMRIAGSEGKESNMISIHGPRIWVDEAQDFPWRAWLSLGNILRLDIPWHMLWVSGVPNGERKDNVLYTCDQIDDQYLSFNIPQTAMSWWTPELERIRRKDYSAIGEDSEDYKHYVLGQHGVPSFSIFDRMRFLKQDFETTKIVLNQHMYDGTKRPDLDKVVRYHIEETVICPPIPTKYGIKPKTVLGYDVGYSPDPAVFFVMYQDVETGLWKNLVRFVLQRVEYALQRDTIVWLDKVYQFDAIGIDMGGPGKVQYQDLTSELSEISYQNQNFSKRLYPVEFGGRMTVALQDSENDEVIEKKDNIKRVAVETVSRWVHEHRFAFSIEDNDLMEELERTKFTRTSTGEPLYKTKDDHQFAAFMCAVMAYENKFGVPLANPKLELKPKLMSAKWIQGV